MIHSSGYCKGNMKAPFNLLSEFKEGSRFGEDNLKTECGVVTPISKVVHVGKAQVEFKLDSSTRQYVAD